MAETFLTGVPAGSGYVPDTPLFGDVAVATLQRTYDPIISTIERNFRFGYKKDPSYDYKKYATDQYIDYAEEFAALPNDMAAIHLRQQIDRSNKSRQTLNQATMLQATGAGFLDPANYLGITFGGPALSIGRAALRTGVSVGAVESMREGLIQATDPTAPIDESLYNIASSMMFGAAVGAVASAPAVSRAQAFKKTTDFMAEFSKLQRANENATHVSPEIFAARAPRETRPLGAVDAAELEAQLNAKIAEVNNLRNQAGVDEGAQPLRDRAVEIEKETVNLRQELGLRYMEDSGFNVDDPYGIPANWFTDSIFYKLITNPMKRALQSKYPTIVKKQFVDLALDMSMALNQNTFGIRNDPSVYLLTSISHGKTIQFETALKSLYGQVQQNPMAFDDWISSVSRKRLAQDPNMSEVELKASSVLEEYFGGDVTTRLENLGLIATAKGRENKINIINQEIDELAKRREIAVEKASKTVDPRIDRQIEIIDARIDDLRKDGDKVVGVMVNDTFKASVYEGVMNDIAASNKRYMDSRVAYLSAENAKDNVIFNKLNATFNARGLTKKQQKFYVDLQTRIAERNKVIAEFEELTAKINGTKSIDDLIAIRNELDLTPKMAQAMDTLSDAIEDIKRRIDGATAAIDAANMEPRKEPFFARFYKHDKIRAERETFIKIVMREFEKNPYVYDFNYETGDYVLIKLDTDPVELRKRAESTTNKILSEGDPVESGDVVAGLGRSKHFRHRTLDIPTSAIIDYIETNPVTVLHTYSARVEPRALFQEKFGKDYHGVRTQMELDMLAAGADEAEINKMRVDFDSLYRRVVSNVLDNPDAMNQKFAYALRNLATFSFMTGAGLTSIPDFGRIVMQYELAPMLKGIQSMIDMDTVRRSGRETQLSGSALEYALGMLRIESQVSNNFVSPKLLNSAQHWFYVLNGLTPLTIAYKKLSGLVMGHTLIDYSIRLVDGTLSASDRTFLAMHGIDEEAARALSKAPWERNKEGLILPNTEQWADHIEIPEIKNKRVTVVEANEDGSPVGKVNSNGEYVGAYFDEKSNTVYFDRDFVEGPMFQRKAWLKPRVEGVEPLPDIFKTPRQWANFVMLHEINHSRFRPEDLGIDALDKAAYENKINQLALADFKAAKKINGDLVDRFRVAINSGITNTVIHGTPADRPIITDGVVHIPMSIASKFGLKEHPVLKGYARVENAFLGLPFQFYNFLFGSMNKTAAAMAHGQVKNRALGAATMLGLAYMVLKAKTPEAIWDKMSYQDRMARVVDSSGLLPFYSDLFYRTMHSTIALGGPNITGGFLQPKFKQRYNPLDVVTDLAGAGPSWAANVGEGLFKIAKGDYGEGTADVLRMWPGANMWFFKDDIRELAQALRG